MGSHRPPVARLYVQHITALREAVQVTQDQGVGNAEKTGERTAVAGDIQCRSRNEARLQGRQACILGLEAGDEGKEALDIWRVAGHAASRLRKVTMIDLEVGVSLSTPALPSGTSTLSSG